MNKVKLSVKSDYAARAVLGLSRQYQSGKALRIEDLAKEQNIPQNYLVQILIELKSQKIVKSINPVTKLSDALTNYKKERIKTENDLKNTIDKVNLDKQILFREK